MAPNVNVSRVSTRSSDFPIVEYIGIERKLYFTTEPQVLYPLQGEKPTPVALLRTLAPPAPGGTATTAGLEIDFTAKLPAGGYRWRALLGDVELMSFNFLMPAADPSRTVTMNLAQPFQPPLTKGNPRPVPWVFKREITLRLERVHDPMHPVEKPITFQVEIYVLSELLPPFFQNQGVPLALLRFPSFLPAWMESVGTDWPAFVISAIFNHPKITYDNTASTSRYQNSNFWNLPAFWLDLWLSDMVCSFLLLDLCGGNPG
jgi:hypothetical protein